MYVIRMAGPTLQAGSLCAVEISLIFPYDGSDLSTRVDKKESKQASVRESFISFLPVG